jgi:hypothetical protein
MDVIGGFVLRVATATCHLAHTGDAGKGAGLFVLGCKLATGPGASVLLVLPGTCHRLCCRATRETACGAKNHG